MPKNLVTVSVKIKIDPEKWADSRGVNDDDVIEDVAEGAVSGDVIKLAAELAREKSRSLSFEADRDQLKKRTENQRQELARLNAVLGHSDETPSPYKDRYYKQLDHSVRLQASLSEKTEKLFDLERAAYWVYGARGAGYSFNAGKGKERLLEASTKYKKMNDTLGVEKP